MQMAADNYTSEAKKKMHNPSSCIRRAEVKNKAFRVFILTQNPAAKQVSNTQPLPSLTETIEFLEKIERSHPLIQRIALVLYSWAKNVDQAHLHRIRAIRFGFGGGGR